MDAEISEASDDENSEPNGKETNGKARKSSTVRVDVNLLDQLMSLAGELVLVRNQLVQSCVSCDSLEVKNAAQQVDHITTELQEAVMATRMQRIGLEFKESILSVIDSGESNLVIDMSKVQILGSSAIGVLASAVNTLKLSRGTVTLRGLSPDILRVLKLMGMTRTFIIQE